MAVVSTFLDAVQASQQSRQITAITRSYTLPASGIGNGDNVQLFTFPAGQNRRIFEVLVTTSGTLGAGATLTVQLNRGGTRTTLSSATTAAAASQGNSYSTVAVPFDAQAGDIIELLVGGAGVTASATVTVDLLTNVR